MARTNRHRINYGNGQVSNTMSKRQATTELARLREHDQYGRFAFIELRTVDGWFKEPK